MVGAEGESMTVVVTLLALERMADPASAIDDAKRWSRQVGVVGEDEPSALHRTLESDDVDPTFVAGGTGVRGSLAAARQRFPTDRHVCIGTTESDRAIAEALGWEYLDVAEAAEAAEWSLTGDPDQ